MQPERIPVIVGAGEITHRTKDPAEGLEPIALMERALRTYKATAYRVGQAEAAAGLGEILLGRGYLGRALDSFHEARRLAAELHNTPVERTAMLGIGDIYRQRGQLLRIRDRIPISQPATVESATPTAAATSACESSAARRTARTRLRSK